ncbi:thiosulfate/3-mercaptopyruvate sulfurtransferase [Stella humosa]|uniref:Thiosulfate/3-mercaptopyruvate sulfurtransferase n=1 Tax=Stella humosa TaxID=94 RepID=A0A3N1L3S5_9PROT|nr:rhodanese-like domain-containing protein [Stella humosa]ROP84055.1 thiosulfate/3-mercaptopyruvate sulfurtransferase [Stella humosa]BBK33566.1 sulfurtransferase [Stella humosa]
MGPLVSTDWLAGHLDDPSIRIFDCTLLTRPAPDGSDLISESGRDAWLAGHLPRAAHVDVQAISDPDQPFRYALPSPDRFSEAAGALGIGQGIRPVLYCRNHHLWAARVWNTLRHYGCADALVLDGGWAKWTGEGRPVEAGAFCHPPARFAASVRPGIFVDADAVAAGIDDPRTVLVNALSPQQHAGRGGVHYGRAGRIPGSVNLPARALTEAGTTAYLPPDRLRSLFAEAGVSAGDRVIVYCGGGVAASSSALALAAIGQEAAVYARSLQEWARDPARPLVRDGD